MIEHWPWYLSGVALASVPIIHWLGLGRSLAVSGRFTAIVNRLRLGSTPEVTLSREEMVVAMRAATLAAFGADALGAPGAASDKEPARAPQSIAYHLVFLAAMVLGGAVSALVAGRWDPAFALQGATFNQMFGSPGATAAVLIGGGLLVGFGTRMAAGCTTGHGLCGVSRFQKGSLAATGAFFGAAIVVSLVLRVVML